MGTIQGCLDNITRAAPVVSGYHHIKELVRSPREALTAPPCPLLSRQNWFYNSLQRYPFHILVFIDPFQPRQAATIGNWHSPSSYGRHDA